MTLRRLTAVAVPAVFALTLAACGGGSATASSASAAPSASGSASAAGTSFTIGYAGAVQANPNNKAVEDGMRVQATSLGMKLVVTDANFDPNKQIADVKSLIQQKVSAIVIWPIDPKGIQPVLAEARGANIPVIVQDTTEGGPYTSNFEVNNEETAAAAAKLVASKVPAGSKAAIIQGLPVVGVLAARNKGFKDGATSAGLAVAAEQVNDKDNADGARPIVDAWKARFGGDLKAVLAYNDPSALGAASAAGGSFTPVVVGMNGDAQGVAAVKDGRLLATYDFRPVELGNGLAWAAHEVLTGKTIPATVHVEMTLIDSSTADAWKPTADRLKAPLTVSLETRGADSFLAVS